MWVSSILFPKQIMRSSFVLWQSRSRHHQKCNLYCVSLPIAASAALGYCYCRSPLRPLLTTLSHVKTCVYKLWYTVLHRSVFCLFLMFNGILPTPSCSAVVFAYPVSSSLAENDIIPLVSHSDLRQPHLSTKAPLWCFFALEKGRSHIFRGTFLFK